MWQLSRSQLNDSVKRQVELASVALERWLDDQKKALDAIAGQLDGKLTVESTPGVGTTFTLLLPRWIDSSDSERSEQNAGVKALVGS